MTKSLEDEIRKLLPGMDGAQEEQPPKAHGNEQAEHLPGEPAETIHIHYFPDALVILKEEEEAQVVDSTPVTPQNVSFLPAYAIGCLYLLLIVSTLAFQLYVVLHPPIATVTILPTSHTVTLSGTFQLGRILTPFTLSQSQTTPTTGKGHQSAKAAAGFITLYNGQFQSVPIAAGTRLTGAGGIQVVTDREVNIPAGNPPNYGQAGVAAHALVSGTRGNIPAYDINQACCAPSVLAKNVQSLTGGQDERDFSTVSQQDITKVSTPLKTSLTHSEAGAFQGQLQPNEHLRLLPCTPAVTTDHQAGEEAIQVHVAVSETCSAVAYDQDALQSQATALLSQQAATKLGTGYSLLGEVHVTVTQVTVTKHHTLVVFAFNALGTWVYAVKSAEQQRIKSLIAGKTKQEAARLLASMPGIEHASIRWGDETKLPTHIESIRVVVMYGI